MDARLIRPALLAALLMVSMGARVKSPNFIVETADPQMAAEISRTAEQLRHDLAIAWIGQTLPNWAQPCAMTVQVAPHLGAGGATTFVFDRGEVFGWRMNIQGSAERVLDSVLPHEITHMVFASYFRRPLPRWADEGGATSMEHISEKQKHREMLIRFLHTGHGIAFGQLFAMTEYPQDVMPLYAEGYSLAEYLINHGGRRRFVAFLAEGMREGKWSSAVQQFYGTRDLPSLQNEWVAWVGQGFPLPPIPLPPADNGVMVASAQVTSPQISAGQSPAPPQPAVVPVSANGIQQAARPESNLIYHIRDREVPSAPPPASGVMSAARPADLSGPPAVQFPVQSAAQPSVQPPAQQPVQFPAQQPMQFPAQPAVQSAAPAQGGTSPYAASGFQANPQWPPR